MIVPLANELRPAAEIIRRWASTKPFVQRVWIYGSRAKGTASPESDLDIATEIDPIGNDENSYISFHHEVDGWLTELQPQLSYKLHLKWYDQTYKPAWEGVNTDGILVYERATLFQNK